MAKAARDEAQLDPVLVIPTGHPPNKQGITPAEDRWKMVCAACAQEEGLTPSRVELDREGVITKETALISCVHYENMQKRLEL
jgi:nicotinate-nucleotide adenylyltransferase